MKEGKKMGENRAKEKKRKKYKKGRKTKWREGGREGYGGLYLEFGR